MKKFIFNMIAYKTLYIISIKKYIKNINFILFKISIFVIKPIFITKNIIFSINIFLNIKCIIKIYLK